MHRSALTQFSFALLVLLIGGSVYVLGRSPDSVYLLPEFFARFRFGTESPRALGFLGHSLPTLAHVYAFAILTYLCLKPSRRAAIGVCSGWLLVDLALELCQLDAAATRIQSMLPDWFSSVPLLENLGPYFVRGTFDPLDVWSILAGSLAALLTLLMTGAKKNENE